LIVPCDPDFHRDKLLRLTSVTPVKLSLDQSFEPNKNAFLMSLQIYLFHTSKPDKIFPFLIIFSTHVNSDQGNPKGSKKGFL